MTGSEFLKRVQKLAKRNGETFTLLADRGKGGHRMVMLGDRMTVLAYTTKEIPKGTLSAMCKQLGIRQSDL